MSADDKAVVNAAATDQAANAANGANQTHQATEIETAEGELPPMTPMDELKDMLKTVGIALLLVLVLRTFLFQPFTIPSASMEPNLYEGDYIIVSKWDYGYSKHSILFSPPVIKGRVLDKAPARGDIVVFKFPPDPSKDYIKRLIGLPGDKIQVRQNQLYINDKIVPYVDLKTIPAEPFAGSTFGEELAMQQEETLPEGKKHLIQDRGNITAGDDTDAFYVPAGHYFMMGDNRDNSSDSRFSGDVGGVGFVPEENLEGKAQFILLSWKPGASIYKPWTWLNLRWNRFFKPLH
jgi:signal peptidase I